MTLLILLYATFYTNLKIYNQMVCGTVLWNAAILFAWIFGLKNAWDIATLKIVELQNIICILHTVYHRGHFMNNNTCCRSYARKKVNKKSRSNFWINLCSHECHLNKATKVYKRLFFTYLFSQIDNGANRIAFCRTILLSGSRHVILENLYCFLYCLGYIG